MCIEKAMGGSASERVQYIRTIMDESKANRLSPAVLFFVRRRTWGALTAFQYGMRPCEKIPTSEETLQATPHHELQHHRWRRQTLLSRLRKESVKEFAPTARRLMNITFYSPGNIITQQRSKGGYTRKMSPLELPEAPTRQRTGLRRSAGRGAICRMATRWT